MHKKISALCFGLVILIFSGCGSNVESLMKQHTTNMNALAEAIEKEKPEAEQKKLEDRVKKTKKELDALAPSKSEIEKIDQIIRNNYAAAMSRLVTAQMMKGPGGNMMKEMMKNLPVNPIPNVNPNANPLIPQSNPIIPQSNPIIPQSNPIIPQ